MNYKKYEIKEHFNDRLKDYEWNTILKLRNDNELHHEIFNTDYYIIGTYEAKTMAWRRSIIYNWIY